MLKNSNIPKCAKRNELSTSLPSHLMLIRLNEPHSLEQFELMCDKCFDIWYDVRGRYPLKTIEKAEHFMKVMKNLQQSKCVCSFLDLIAIFDDCEIDEDDGAFYHLGFDCDMLMMLEREGDEEKEQSVDYFDANSLFAMDNWKRLELYDDSTSDEESLLPLITPRTRRRIMNTF